MARNPPPPSAPIRPGAMTRALAIPPWRDGITLLEAHLPHYLTSKFPYTEDDAAVKTNDDPTVGITGGAPPGWLFCPPWAREPPEPLHHRLWTTRRSASSAPTVSPRSRSTVPSA